MTTPKVKTLSRGGSRFYIDPENGRKNPGVTSVLNMLPKGFLKFWAAKEVATFAVENLGSVVGLAMTDQRAAIDLLKGAPNRVTGKAADIGTEAHDYFERLAKGERIVGRIHPDLAPFVEHFREFLAVCEPEFVFMEETVWSDALGVAGSFDALATLKGDGAGPLKGKTLFMDWKTTRSGVHEEVALQLAAYRESEYIVRPDGSRVPMPKTDGAACLHVRPEGWALYPIEVGDIVLGEETVRVLDYFKALREVFDWDREVKKHVIGKPVAAGGEFSAAKPATRINVPKGAKK